MTDGITMGSGNSRYLRSVSGFLSLYPTYEAFAQALISGTLPIDLNGLNPDGWVQEGTELNKANLLTDATAAIMGLGSEATPNDMLAALANKAAQTLPIADGGTGRTTAAEALYALINGSPGLNGANAAVEDFLALGDASEVAGKKMTLEELRNFLFQASTEDLEAGVSPLPDNKLYFVYE